MATEHDLQFYIDNPNEVPSDPKILEELLAQMNGSSVPADETDPDKQAEKSAAAGADGDDKKVDDGKQQEDKASEAKDAKDESADPEKKEAEGEPEGISTRDGKRVIPYDVLKSERERRQVAEEAVSRLTSEVEAIKQQLAKGTTAGDEAATKMAEAAEELLSPEDLAALREDFPVFGKVVDKLLGTISGLNEQVASLSQREAGRDKEIRTEAATTVQEVIDNIPILTYLQANDPKLFAKAVEIDNALKGNPKYPTLADRLQKVAERMHEDFGPFDGVAAPAPVKETKTTKVEEKPPVDKEAARQDVKKALESKKTSPKSLSDLPGGEPGADTEETELEEMSPAEISAKLMKMNPDQRTAYLNNLRMS